MNAKHAATIRWIITAIALSVLSACRTSDRAPESRLQDQRQEPTGTSVTFDPACCRHVESPFRGEVFGSAIDRYDTSALDTLARLTFSPQFPQLMNEIDRFIDSLTKFKLL